MDSFDRTPNFTLFTTLLGCNIETAFFPSIAEAERHFDDLVAAGMVDQGQIYPFDIYFEAPVRTLTVRR